MNVTNSNHEIHHDEYLEYEESSDSDEEHVEANLHLNAPQRNESSKSATSAKALIISASDKAGMQNIDRERINAILMRESGNSAFIQRQKKMDEKNDKKINDMKRKLQERDATGEDWRRQLLHSTINPLIQTYQSRRRTRSTCAVIDMDGFFISCHVLHNPHLATIPACVGGSSMISTSNYIARRYGVRAAMPGYLGSMLVKELSSGKESLTFVKSDFELYKRKSAEVKTVLQEYDPQLKMYSLDEAYMDIGPYLDLKLLKNEMSHEDIQSALMRNKITEEYDIQSTSAYEHYHVSAQNLLHLIRQKVKDVTGLTCSAGLASNFLLAKVASDVNKPNGQHFIGPAEQEIRSFIHPLACRKVSGIGRVTEKILQGALSIETVHDLYEKRAEVFYLFKQATAHFLIRASIGYSESGQSEDPDEDDSEESVQRKGISHERTFSPISDWTYLCTKVETIAHSLIQDLKERNLRPKTITLKVKLANFDIISKSTSREVALFQPGNIQQSSKDLVDVVLKLLKEAKISYSSSHNDSFAVRLLGVRCSNFQTTRDTQISLDRYCGKNSPFEASEQLGKKSESQSHVSPIVANPYTTSPKRCNDSRIPSGKTTASPLQNNPRVKTDIVVQCPICGVSLNSGNDNSIINAHIDSCLNASTVRQMTKEETLVADEKYMKTKRKRSISDFFHPQV